MTDLERALAYWAADEWPDQWEIDRKRAAAGLLEEFTAVRLDERRAIVAYLDAQATERPFVTVSGPTAVAILARRIERGAHTEAGS